MIVFDLCCPDGHRFEGWFSSSEDYQDQKAKGYLSCPQCGSAQVEKAPMAPAVPKKGNQLPISGLAAPTNAPAEVEAAQPEPMSGGAPGPEVQAAMEKLAKLQAEVLKESTWVGDKFAEQSRAMHYGESDAKAIHGKASPKEAKELLEEGIAVAPLPMPFTPPDELN